MPVGSAAPIGYVLQGAGGLRAELCSHGALRRLDCDSIILNLFLGNELEGGPANVYLRAGGAVTPLLGPASKTRCLTSSTSEWRCAGSWGDINYSIALMLAGASPAWFLHVLLNNAGSAAITLELTYAQDLALAAYGAVRLNEYYVSQYVDHTPLRDQQRGVVVVSRQNQAVDGRNPWSMIGSLRSGRSFATDASQLVGLAARAGVTPDALTRDLPDRRLQHEHSMVVLRDTPIELRPGEQARGGFFGLFVPHHPEASGQQDLKYLTAALSSPEAAPASARRAGTAAGGDAGVGAAAPCASLFSSAAVLNGLPLDTALLDDLFGASRRHEEHSDDGSLLSFFHGNHQHVVLEAKERQVLRPHGHILRTGLHVTPDESALTSTVWMSGVFHSMLTQGHVSINRFLSTVHSYVGLFRSHGQRIFIELDGRWQLLNIPSAFEMAVDACRWIYRYEHGILAVRAAAHSDAHELTLSIAVASGQPTRFLISHHVALNGDDGTTEGAVLWRSDGADIIISPSPAGDVGQRFPHGSFRISPRSASRFQQVGGDELLFADGTSRRQPFLCIVTEAVAQFELGIRGFLIEPATQKTQRAASQALLAPAVEVLSCAGDLAQPLARLAEIVPWFAQNAYVHYLSPRGLEQYSGGGWGTRDVCQGPVEMLFALGYTRPVRDLLLRVMAQQNPDGDWPQWFMFFNRERAIRAGDSHGDIVFWPVLVFAQYLVATGDATILNEPVAFFTSDAAVPGETASVWQHVTRAIALIERRVIPGTALAAYGHGDWNDALQPAEPRLRERMCSSWTVTLHYQTLKSLAEALNAVGRPADAVRFDKAAQAVKRDFQRLLVVGGVLTGYAHFEDDAVRYLLHPDDETTGVHYSSLAMIHAILEDVFTPDQARHHLQLIDQHLKGPDGLRLFDRPMPYHGGPQKIFQRAETATFFGREIGLMYMHAHLRYAQALAHIGDAPGFFNALNQADPIEIGKLVSSASRRQSNCYYSSSDAAFADRYQAAEEYQRVNAGSIALDGGWRVYSSGAGIMLGLIVRRFLGVSYEATKLRLDPVIPAALDGLRIGTRLYDRSVELHYSIRGSGCGVNSVHVNDHEISFLRARNLHRGGAALLERSELIGMLTAGRNEIRIDLGQ